MKKCSGLLRYVLSWFFFPVVLCIKKIVIISNTELKEGRSQHQAIVYHTQTGEYAMFICIQNGCWNNLNMYVVSMCLAAAADSSIRSPTYNLPGTALPSCCLSPVNSITPVPLLSHSMPTFQLSHSLSYQSLRARF